MPARPLALAALAKLAALAPACSESGPDCGAVGDRAVELIRAEIRAESDPEERDAMESMLGPLKDGIVADCEGDDWSADARACFVTAETMAAADDCAQRAAADPDPDSEEGRATDSERRD